MIPTAKSGCALSLLIFISLAIRNINEVKIDEQNTITKERPVTPIRSVICIITRSFLSPTPRPFQGNPVRNQPLSHSNPHQADPFRNAHLRLSIEGPENNFFDFKELSTSLESKNEGLPIVAANAPHIAKYNARNAGSRVQAAK